MKRWLLWNIRCLRGRRCADVVVRPKDTMPAGTVLGVDYWCGGCGTHYQWNSETFTRQQV